MRKIDAENRQLKKEHVDGGGSRKYFVRKPYPVECEGYIKATKIKKSSDYHVDPFLQYVIQESSEHTCTTPLSPLCGSRFVPYSIPKISQSIHHIMKNEPSMNPCQIGYPFKLGNSLSDESINYGHIYCVQKAADVLRWDTPIQHFGGLVNMLEILKSY